VNSQIRGIGGTAAVLLTKVATPTRHVAEVDRAPFDAPRIILYARAKFAADEQVIVI
jgi:hypothetical protein